MKKRGRPRIGKEVRKRLSIRIEPKIEKELIKKYGSIQKYFDIMLRLHFWRNSL